MVDRQTGGRTDGRTDEEISQAARFSPLKLRLCFRSSFYHLTFVSPHIEIHVHKVIKALFKQQCRWIDPRTGRKRVGGQQCNMMSSPTTKQIVRH